MTATTETVLPPLYLTSVDTCRMSGATYRQLDYWTTLGYLPAYAWDTESGEVNRNPGSRHVRVYRSADLRLVRRLVGLSRVRRLSLADLLSAARTGELAPGVRVVFDGDLA